MNNMGGGIIGAIILARMDSRRLPGKVLAEVAGKPVLWYIVERLKSVSPALPIILATSGREVDDLLAEFAEASNIGLWRGSLDNVAQRFLDAARHNRLDAAFRINGDSPFIDRELISAGLKAYGSSSVDLVTNLHPRSYPYGVSLELIRVGALAAVLGKTSDPEDREHITRAFYRSRRGYRIVSLGRPGKDAENPETRVRLTIDTEADLLAFRRFIQDHQAEWSVTGFSAAIDSGLFGLQSTP